MNTVLQTPQRLLMSVSMDELTGICNALNEVCHGIQIEDFEFATRLGVSRAFLSDLLTQLGAGVKHTALRVYDRTAVWADGGSVQAICITVSGDPVDLSCDEARAFADQFQASITEADGRSER